MVEMYALGCHILLRGGVQPGETVAILGAGKLGLSVLDVLCHGADPGTTIVTDCQPFRLETARKLGADYAINVAETDPVAAVNEITGGKGVDCVIECVGHFHTFAGQEPPLGQAVRMARPAGRVVACGLSEELSPVHFKTLVFKEAPDHRLARHARRIPARDPADGEGAAAPGFVDHASVAAEPGTRGVCPGRPGAARHDQGLARRTVGIVRRAIVRELPPAAIARCCQHKE